VLSSHELERAQKLADRVVELVGGTTSPSTTLRDLTGEGASHVA
jgi:hypothetical protein